MSLKDYTIIIPTMGASEIFKRCLNALNDSKNRNSFGGSQVIIVEDGNSHRELARGFSENLGFNYLKNPEWTCPDALVDLALRSGLANTKYIVYSHNDVEFYSGWLEELDAAIHQVPEKYFGMMNFPYNQYLLKRADEPCNPQNCTFQTVVNSTTNLGLASDLWSQNRVGRMSVVSCFLRQDWEAIGNFSIGTGFDWELHYKFLIEKRWNLYFKSSQPMKHLNLEFGFGSDTQNNKQKYLQIRDESYKKFYKKYGIDINVFLDLWFGDIQFQMQNEISELIAQDNWEELEQYCPEISSLA